MPCEFLGLRGTFTRYSCWPFLDIAVAFWYDSRFLIRQLYTRDFWRITSPEIPGNLFKSFEIILMFLSVTLKCAVFTSTCSLLKGLCNFFFVTTERVSLRDRCRELGGSSTLPFEGNSNGYRSLIHAHAPSTFLHINAVLIHPGLLPINNLSSSFLLPFLSFSKLPLFCFLGFL